MCAKANSEATEDVVARTLTAGCTDGDDPIRLRVPIVEGEPRHK